MKHSEVSQGKHSEVSQAKQLLCSPCSDEDYNRSTAKRLFSSVFSIIDNDQEVSTFDDEQTSNIDALLGNASFLTHLQAKISMEGFYDGYKFPLLRLRLEGERGEREVLEESDISGLGMRFGQLGRVVLTRDRREAYLFFNVLLNAYICCKLLTAIKLRTGGRELGVEWVHNCGYHPEVANEVHSFIGGLEWGEAPFLKGEPDYDELAPLCSKQSKFTCRFDIQIDNEREFQVARRIIGPKGCHMKRIIEEAVSPQLRASSDNLNELLKLRLRGRGSGYKEGAEQQESAQNLHLCVSAKDQTAYNQACQKVEKLLDSIYQDYADFTRRQGRAAKLNIKKVMLGQSAFSDENNSLAENVAGNLDKLEEGPQAKDLYRIGPQKIGELLQLRNKARRQLNFSEADRIRNYLRSLGVCLVDEKGRRGKATDVTAWKYVY